MPKNKNVIYVTDVVKFILDLLSKSFTIHFKRYMYFVDHELSQISQLGRRKELCGSRGICRFIFSVIIFSQDLIAIFSAL